MPLITLGTDYESDTEKNVKSGVMALVALGLVAGAAFLGRSGATKGWSKFSEEWPEREDTRELPRENMSDVVFHRRR